jgi:hypothetical protein
MKKETRLVVFTLSAWFCLALAFTVTGLFRTFSAPAVALTVWTLTAAALLACWKISDVRHWAATVHRRSLLAVHLTRFVGFYFLFLSKRGDLPEAFALPAGIGDILVAAGALVLMIVPQLGYSRRALLGWNIFGFVDIIFVVFSALRLGLRDWVSMAPLRQLPLSLLPTFLVPLIIVSHILIFGRAMSARRNTEGDLAPKLPRSL